MLVGQADCAPHPLCDRRRGDRDAESRGDPLIGLEEPEPGSELLGERRRRALGQPLDETLRPLGVGRPRRLHERAAPVGQLDRDTAAIFGIGLALDHPRVLEASEANRDGSRGAAHAGDELTLVERLPVGAVERVEYQEARAREPVLGERLLELALEVGGDADRGVGQLAVVQIRRHTSLQMLESKHLCTIIACQARTEPFGAGAGGDRHRDGTRRVLADRDRRRRRTQRERRQPPGDATHPARPGPRRGQRRRDLPGRLSDHLRPCGRGIATGRRELQ